MYLIISFLMIAIIVVLLVVYVRLSSSTEPPAAEFSGLPREEGRMSPCPLCSEMIKSGERVKSVVYPGKGDRLVEIYGCPYCYPPNSAHPRFCPSCKRKLDQDELVFARLFDTGAKVHVHVNGCRVCMRRRS